MLRRLVPIAVVCMFLGTGIANSTTVVAPTFDQLVSGAQLIFVGEVIDMHAYWEDNGKDGRSIVTKVTFRVEDTWKGSVGVITQLEFLGGTIGDRTMRVAEMPQFRIGQRDVLFVGDTVRAASPLVGFMFGRMRVEREPATGVDRVRTYDGQSLGSTSQLGASRTPSMLAITPMRLSELESSVRARGRQH